MLLMHRHAAVTTVNTIGYGSKQSGLCSQGPLLDMTDVPISPCLGIRGGAVAFRHHA